MSQDSNQDNKTIFQENEEQKQQDNSANYFMYLTDLDRNCPLWSSYIHSIQNPEVFMSNVHPSIKSQFKKIVPEMDSSEKIHVFIDTVNSMELPHFKDNKQLSCAPSTTILAILQYMSDKLKFQDFFVMPPNQFKLEEMVEVVVEKGEHLDENGEKEKEYIKLGNQLVLSAVQKCISN